MIILPIIIFILILGLLVFVHELGHFIMAKRAGMTVEEFGFGFPPRIFGVKRGGTVYSLNWIPLGGFVKILGEDGGEVENINSFASKSASQRFSVLVAGVVMNIILAWVLISLGLGLGLPTIISENENLPKSAKVANVSVAVIDVAVNSPAYESGIKMGDSILEVNATKVTSITQLQDLTKQSAGTEVEYLIKRGNEKFIKKVTPRDNPPPNEGPLGVGLSSLGFVSYPWYEVFFRGLGACFNLLILTLSAFATVIGQWLSGHSVSAALSGPIGIAFLTKDVAELGFIYVLQFTALLSVNLAVINIIPFPALDGGRILFLLIEKLRGRKMHIKVEQVANTVGFLLLLLLMAVVTVWDVNRFSENFKKLFEKVLNIFL